jgi:hypothetical protein
MNVKLEALAFRIWAYAQPKGWDCLMSEVATALGVGLGAVRIACTHKGWNSRFRVAKTDTTAQFGSFSFRHLGEEEINRMADQAENDDR